MRKFFQLHPNIVTILSWAAVIVLPWQARWIYSYHTIAGVPYEYGALSIYLGSVVLWLAVLARVLVYRRHAFTMAQLVSLGALLAWLCVGSLIAHDPVLAVGNMIVAVSSFGYFVLVRYWSAGAVIRALIVNGLVQAGIAWVQFANQKIWASTLLGVSNHFPWVLGESVVSIHGIRYLRAYGLFTHPNVLGGFLAIVLMGALYWIWTLDYQNPIHRLRARAVVMILFAAMLITFSRAALVVFVAGYGVAVVLSLVRKRHRAFMADMLVTCGVVLLMVNLATGSVLLQRFGLHAAEVMQVQLDERSTDERLVAYHESEVLVSERGLVFGWGLGNYVSRLAEAFPGRPAYAYQPVHNAYLIALLEIGLPGVALLLWWLWRMSGLRGVRRKHVAEVFTKYRNIGLIAGCLVVALFDHYLWTNYSGQSLLWLSLGLVLPRE